MGKLLNLLSGYKSYLGLIGLGITGILFKMGMIPQDTAEYLAMVLGPLAGIGVAHKLDKIKKDK